MRLALCWTIAVVLPTTLAVRAKRHDGPILASTEVLQNPFPYDFPDQSQPPNKLFPMELCRGLKLEEATIDQLQEWMSSDKLTSQELVICYIQRITQTDGYIRYVASTSRASHSRTPRAIVSKHTNIADSAILELNPDYMQIAVQLDKLRRAGTVLGPLHGIPFLVKDNIASKDKMETTAGSWALQGSIVPRDSHVVSQLRAAGALLMGKATLSEWADMRSNNYSEGYSGRGGQARSAYNLTVNPGGSSSGSAIAVAANSVTFALGTETDGSGE